MLKAVNRTGHAEAATIRIDGVTRLAETARVTNLSHSDPDAENTLFDPELVVPGQSAFRGVATQFPYTLEPYSLTILRIGIGVRRESQ